MVSRCLSVGRYLDFDLVWLTCLIEFDKLNRFVEKVKQSGPVPKVYIKAVADLEEFMNESAKDKTSGKKMNAANARSLNTTKQRIKKNNRTYDREIELYRADKDAFMVEEEVEEKPVPKKSKKEQIAARENIAPEVDDDEGFSTIVRGGKAVLYTPESIFKHLKVIIEARGKKNTDRNDQIKTMEKLLEISQTPYQKIKVLLALISTRFDLTSGATNYMATEQWKK